MKAMSDKFPTTGTYLDNVPAPVRMIADAIETEERYIPVDDAISGYCYPIYGESLSTIDCVAMFSDGVCDFKNTNNVPAGLPVTTVISELMNFRNCEGEFIKRRLSMALKSFAKDDVYPYDDVSVAAIKIVHETENTTNE